MSRALRARIARLEARLERRPFPRLVAHLYNHDPESIIGFGGDRAGTRISVVRLACEPLAACEARAWELIGSHFLFALYRPQKGVGGDDAAPADAPSPQPTRVDPWALAGIGREATRAELEKAGAIPFPVERLID